MIVKITVTPKNERGVNAINQHFKEIGVAQKTFMKSVGVKQEQLSDGSLLLRVPAMVRLKAASWRDLVDSTMSANGAKKEDYSVAVNFDE